MPTGVPLVYELGDDMRPAETKAPLDRALGDVAAIKAAADAVKKRGRLSPRATVTVTAQAGRRCSSWGSNSSR